MTEDPFGRQDEVSIPPNSLPATGITDAKSQETADRPENTVPSQDYTE